MKIIDKSATAFGVPQSVLDALSPKSREAVNRLLLHEPEAFDLSVSSYVSKVNLILKLDFKRTRSIIS